MVVIRSTERTLSASKTTRTLGDVAGGSGGVNGGEGSYGGMVEVAAWLLMRDGDDVEAGLDRSGRVVLLVAAARLRWFGVGWDGVGGDKPAVMSAVEGWSEVSPENKWRRKNR
ncbi:hypothetical protein Tco_0363647 [Tanacetum coccineum]